MDLSAPWVAHGLGGHQVTDTEVYEEVCARAFVIKLAFVMNQVRWDWMLVTLATPYEQP